MWEVSGSAIINDRYDEVTNFPYWYDTRMGNGLIGFIKSVYIWKWAKAYT